MMKEHMFDIEAEESLLADCLMNGDLANEIAFALEPDDFMREAHKVLFRTIKTMVDRPDPLGVDPISVKDMLARQGELAMIGGPSALIDISSRHSTGALCWRTHVDIVKQNALQRRLLKAGNSIMTLAREAELDPDRVIAEAEACLFEATAHEQSKNTEAIFDVFKDVYADLVELRNDPDAIHGVPTGFSKLDSLLNGLRAGDLVIVAARPGVGKTAFALNAAMNAMKQGARVAFFSLEMSSKQLVERILSSETRIPLSSIRSARLSDDDMYELSLAGNSFMQSDLHIDETPGLSVPMLMARARRIMRDRGDRRGLLVVDYLQLMESTSGGRERNRANEVAEISRGLKLVAKELGVPIIALSQLNRSVEMRASKRPQLSDLRESGSIEQDADVVMFVDRSTDDDEASQEGRPDPGEANIIVSKHRNGPLGTVKLAFNGRCARFADAV